MIKDVKLGKKRLWMHTSWMTGCQLHQEDVSLCFHLSVISQGRVAIWSKKYKNVHKPCVNAKTKVSCGMFMWECNLRFNATVTTAIKLSHIQ